LMRLLIEHNHQAAKWFARAAASRYVRAKQLLSDLGEYESLGDIARALDLIFDLEPEALDAVLQELCLGADIEAKRNIAKIYAEAWREYNPRGEKKNHPEARLRIGLDRLIWIPSQVFDQKVLSTVASAFSYPPHDAWFLIEKYADKLVGAALLIDEQVSATDTLQGKQTALHDDIERKNLRSAAYHVAENFLITAAKASRSEASKMRFIEAVKAIPEDRALLRGTALGASIQLMDDVAGLKAVLPMLYSCLVGVSVIARAKAASALSEISARSRQNLPALVYEAFCALLLDRFVAVHKCAVRTLGQISLPDDLKPRAAFALLQLVTVYSQSKKEDDFLVDCINKLARFADCLTDPDTVRSFCCQALLKVQPLYVRSKSWSCPCPSRVCRQPQSARRRGQARSRDESGKRVQAQRPSDRSG
jgi:hypothetical protein